MGPRIIFAAIIGFFVALFWFVMTFIFFTWDASGPWGAVYGLMLFITCPAWLVPLAFLVPFLNAALYAAVALAVQMIIRRLKEDEKSLGA